MQTKQSPSKQTKARASRFIGKTIVAILAAVIAVGAIQAGAQSLGRLMTSAVSMADVARPDLWEITKSKLHN